MIVAHSVNLVLVLARKGSLVFESIRGMRKFYCLCIAESMLEVHHEVCVLVTARSALMQSFVSATRHAGTHAVI